MYTLTQHAHDRMVERDVTIPMINAVLTDGYVHSKEPNGVRTLGLYGVEVVVDEADRRIITAYHDNRARQAWREKRRAMRVKFRRTSSSEYREYKRGF
jgi:hypothetical protein